MREDGSREYKMDKTIKSAEFRGVLTEIMSRILWGLEGLEFIPGPELRYVKIPRKHIKLKTRTITINQNDQQGGIEFDKFPNIWILGDPEDLGLLLVLSPYAIYKRGAMADWANYIEIFGVPMRVIKYDATDDQTKIELKQILDESGSAMALMIPKQADFEAQDGKHSNGDGQLQERFIDKLDSQMSIAVLGNTETTSQNAHSGGNNAKAQTHQEQQYEITKADMLYVAATLNSPQFFKILKSYGLPVEEGGYFTFIQEYNFTTLKDRALIDQIVSQKVPYPAKYWYETYGVPLPDNLDQAIEEFESKKGGQQQPTDPDLEEEPDENTPPPGQKPKPGKGKSNKKKQLGKPYKASRLKQLFNAVKDFFA